jgi:catechol 2,3-dioxygenase
MGVTTGDIYGDAASGAQPATPGSYGLAPQGFRLPQGTRIGAVRLQIADLSRSIAYYEKTLGLRVLERSGTSALLGPHGTDTPLVELHQRTGLQRAPRHGRFGLYHFALLLPDRASLGRFVRHVGTLGERIGSADHLVSESLYLQDPDNLGIEVYADRPRAQWRRIGRELMMATDPLDIPGLLRDAGSMAWTGMPAGTVMGHVHLHVGDIAGAGAFYSDALGFDRMVWEYPGALFFGANGYHHNLGTNTWAGSDATPPPPDEAQLLAWTIALPDRASLEHVSESLNRAGFPARREGDGFAVRDPWGTEIRLS